MPPVLYRFTRDLRLEDHAGLAAASAQGEILPVLVIDAPLRARIGSSPRRASYYCVAVADLDRVLRERGTRLLVRRGSASAVLRSLARDCGAACVAWSASFDRAGMKADQDLQSALEEAGLRATIVHDAPAIAPEESTAARPSAGEGYRSFSAYYDLWRELVPASYELPLLLSFANCEVPSEELPQPEEFDAVVVAAPRSPVRAQQDLEEFLAAGALQYAFALGSPADDRTSHLGAALSFGIVSAREVVRGARRRLDDPFLLAEERSSVKLFLRSIAMRDFFLQLAWYHPRAASEPLQEKMRNFPFEQKHRALDAWREGRTGYPLVDAGIRQLRETGWMHPRVRSIAASFLCFDLGVHWSVGMAEWEKHLVEDEPALSIGNWQWIAGVGADLAAYPRIFNPRKQAHRFDPMAIYAKRWIPELAHVPAGAIGIARGASPQLNLPLYDEDAYPQPVVDHDLAARDFLKRYQKFTAE